jgi:hypothetical protein
MDKDFSTESDFLFLLCVERFCIRKWQKLKEKQARSLWKIIPDLKLRSHEAEGTIQLIN